MFDAKTGMLLWSMVTLTLSALLCMLWLHDRSKKHPLLFSLGFASVSIGALLVAMRGEISGFLSVVIGNTLSLTAYAFWLAAFLRINGRKMEGWIAIPALIWIGLMFIPAIREGAVARVLIFHACAGIGCLMMAAVVFRFSTPLTTTRKIFVGALVANAILGVVAASFVIPFHLLEGQTQPLTPPVAFSSAVSMTALLMIALKMFMEDGEQKLQRLSMTDHLTGILNRRGLRQEFEALCANRHNRSGQLTLALFDIDHFKAINDRYGHACGDEVLVAFCRLAERVIGDKGVFARMGGEEFAYLLADDDIERMTCAAEGIRSSFSRMRVGDQDRQVSATVSVGLCAMPFSKADLDLMLTRADRALYAAKDAGRNRIVLHENDAHIVLSAPDRDGDPHDNNADRQVAALTRIATIASR